LTVLKIHHTRALFSESFVCVSISPSPPSPHPHPLKPHTQATNDDGEVLVVAKAEPLDAQQPGVGVAVAVDVSDVVAEEDLSVGIEEETLK